MKTMPRDNDFGLLIKNMRERQGITREQLCEGLCTVSMLGKIESGERYPEKMMRDRLLGRLGAAQDNFENFLNLKEYDKWCERTQVLSGLENERQDVEQLIEEYGVHSGHDALARQTYLDMKGQYIKQQSGEKNEELLYRLYSEAVGITMPGMLNKYPLASLTDITDNYLSGYFLSVRELNLYIEYIRYALKTTRASEADEGLGVRCFMNIFAYIESSNYDEKCLAKIYPKAVVCLYNEWKRTERIITALELLDMCNKAVECLRTVEKAYYLWELLDIRRQIISDYRNILVVGDGGVEDAELEELRVQTDNWLSVLEEVYSQYNINYKMTNECYFYQENNVYCINDVIRNRRRMLGLSRAKLCNGICTEKTLVAIEGKKCNPQRPIVKELFVRLGLPTQFQWASIVTTDYEDILLKEKIVHSSRAGRHIKTLELIGKLKERLPDNIINRQWIARQDILIKSRMDIMPYEMLIQEIKEILSYTINLEGIIQRTSEIVKNWNDKSIYLTHSEALCLISLGNLYLNYKLNDEAYLYIEIMYKHFLHEKDGYIRSYRVMYEVAVIAFSSLLGNMEKYEASDIMSDEASKILLRGTQLGSIHLNLYNNAWNYMKKTGDNSQMKKQLQKCMFLSQISKSESHEYRYMKRMDKY